MDTVCISVFSVMWLTLNLNSRKQITSTDELIKFKRKLLKIIYYSYDKMRNDLAYSPSKLIKAPMNSFFLMKVSTRKLDTTP